jgi:putative holliday junction resolvase
MSMLNPSPTNSVVALDVGEKRIGVATANLITLLPHPLKTLKRTAEILHDIVALLQEQRAVAVVLGLPRGLEGQETAQTHTVQRFGHELGEHLAIPMYWQDEAVTSRQAEEELRARGKPFEKGDIDALAATYILEDFLREHKELI